MIEKVKDSNNIIEIKNILKGLHSSPILYLSYFSRELFHSSFWYWLSKLDKLETIKLLGGRIVYDHEIQKIEVKQEYKSKNKKVNAKIDLAFLEKEKPIIILENKIKDYPTKNQLEKISNSIENGHHNIQYILTTLFPINEKSELPEEWRIVLYNDIANRLNPDKFASKNTPDYYLIQSYKSFLTDLSSLSDVLDKTYVQNKYNFSKKGNRYLYDQLNIIKFWEVYAKYRSSHFTDYIKNKLKSNKDLRKFWREEVPNIAVTYSINNKKATVAIFFNFSSDMSRNNDAVYYGAGIQIEDDQYRRFVGINPNYYGEGKEYLDEWVKSKFWEGTNRYKLNGKERVFYYKYDKLGEETNLKLNDISFVKLYTIINRDLLFIKDNFNKFKNMCRQ